MSRIDVSVCVKRLFVAMAALGAAACGGGEEGGGGIGAALSGGCKGTFPVSQQVSQGCCPEWGPDACGAGLFCAAFDGRAQPTCYLEHSRSDMTECTEDVQCASGSCDPTRSLCRSSPEAACDASLGCGSMLTGNSYVCTGHPATCTATTGKPGQPCAKSDDCIYVGLECSALSMCAWPAGGHCINDEQCLSHACDYQHSACL